MGSRSAGWIALSLGSLAVALVWTTRSRGVPAPPPESSAPREAPAASRVADADARERRARAPIATVGLPPWRLEGPVLDAAGGSVAGARVRVRAGFHGETEEIGETTAGADGAYVVDLWIDASTPRHRGCLPLISIRY